MTVAKLLLYFYSIPKTIYFNFKYFNFRDALKIPVIISHRVWLLNCAGNVSIEGKKTFGMIKIGFGDVGIFDQCRSRSILEIYGNIIFHGTANIGHGSKISVAKGATLKIGSNFVITAESSILCSKMISIGNDCLISWENLVMDTDYHKIKRNKNVINLDKEINIGNHVWIGCRCTVLKGTYIGDDSVIAANSKVSGCFNENNVIISGNPSKVIINDINWER